MYNLYSVFPQSESQSQSHASCLSFEVAPLSKQLQQYSKYSNANLDTYFDMEFLHILNIYALLICYMSVFYSLYMLNNSEKRRAKQSLEYNNKTYKIQNEIQFPIVMLYYKVNNILADTDISDDIKINVLDTFLHNSSLNKYYIIYFIFTKQYNFFIDNDKDEINSNGETVHYTHIKLNSYEEYKKIKREYGGSINCNLDETVETDLVVNLYNYKKFNTYDMIYDKTYNTCNAHINFISWVYYSGLYTYLMNNINIKMKILNEMNKKQLLYGSMFLQYKLFLANLDDDEPLSSNLDDDDDDGDDGDGDDNESLTSKLANEPLANEPLETEPLGSDPLETELLDTEPLETEPLDTDPLEDDNNFTNSYNNNNTTITDCLINTAMHIKQTTNNTFANILNISYNTIINTITNIFIYVFTNIIFYCVNKQNKQDKQDNKQN